MSNNDENVEVAVQPKLVSPNEQARSLQSALYFFVKSNPFNGNLIQEMRFRFSRQVPLAAIGYDRKHNTFNVYLNPERFCGHTPTERVAILCHEIMHFTNQHLFRTNFEAIPEKDRVLWNIAGDLAINQFIEGLPKDTGIVYPEMFKDNSGQPFPKFKTMEEYQRLLEETKNNEHNKELLSKYEPFDSHDWEQLTAEEKERMLREAGAMVRRTIVKTSYDFSNLPGNIQDFIQYIENSISKIDYKGVLRKVIKRTLAVSDREPSRYRPNKRYGVYAPGTTVGRVPNLDVFLDCSGSISHTEMSAFMEVLSGFLKVGAKKCMLGLWHTELFYYKKFKQNESLKEDDMQSGGTDPSCVLAQIKKSKPNLAIILTDGHYDRGTINLPGSQEVLWVISEDGNVDHPYKNLGTTIKFSTK